MRKVKKVTRRGNPYSFILALLLGMVLAVGGSVFATTVGNSVTVSGSLTLNGNGTFGDASTDINLFTGTLQASTTALFTGAVTTYGNVTLGDAAGDTFTVTGTSITYSTAGTTTIPSTSAVAWAYATSSADIPLLRLDTSNTRIGISTTTPGATLAIGGAGNIYALGGLGVGLATTTAGAIENSGNVLFGDASGDLVMFNAATLIHNNAGTTTIPTSAVSRAYATSTANIPLVRFDASNTRVGISTTTPGATLAVGGDGTAIIMGGATSTLSIQSTANSAASRGGCIELESTAGDGTRFSLMATGAGIAYWTTGGCR